MIKYILFSFALLAFAPALEAQVHEVNDEMKIREVLLKQEEAWNNFNIESFMEGYWRSDSLMFLGTKGINYGWQITLDRYKKSYPTQEAMGKLKFDVLQMTRLSKDSYFLTGKYYLTRTIGDASGMFTLIFKKIKGKWVIIYDHTN